MKYVCLGYMAAETWEGMSEDERQALVGDCLAYDAELREAGRFLRGEALQSAENAATLRWSNGRIVVTDGPYAETKEQLGGLLVLEADDLNHAIQIMSKHPGVRMGPFEIRPLDEEFMAAAGVG